MAKRGKKPSENAPLFDPKKFLKKKAQTRAKRKRLKYLDDTRNEDGTLKIPEYIQDEECYKKYVELHDKIQLDPQLYWETSDPDVVVNLLQTTYRITNAINHLPQEEQTSIQAKASEFRGLRAQASLLMKKALGSNYYEKGAVDQDNNRIQNKRFYDERGSELIEYFGRYFTLHEVHKIINEDWGYVVGLDSLRAFRIEHINAISERQEEYKSSLTDVRLGYKKSRLEELSILHSSRKAIYERNENREDSKELRAILEQIRKEMEGDTLTINGKINVNMDIKINNHINQEIMKGLSIKQLIMARVAAKFNINPTVLQYQLVNSYYAKFTGFKPADDNILTDEIIYPSSYIYDFDTMKAKNKQVEAEDAEIISDMTPTVDVEEKRSLEDIRASIMKKLLLQKELNNRTKETITTKRLQKKRGTDEDE